VFEALRENQGRASEYNDGDLTCGDEDGDHPATDAGEATSVEDSHGDRIALPGSAVALGRQARLRLRHGLAPYSLEHAGEWKSARECSKKESMSQRPSDLRSLE